MRSNIRGCNEPDTRPADTKATNKGRGRSRSRVSATTGTSIYGRHYRGGQSNRDRRSTDGGHGDDSGRRCYDNRGRSLLCGSRRSGDCLQAENRRWDYGGVRHGDAGCADDRDIGDQLGGGRHGYGCASRYRDNRRWTGGGGGRGC